MAGPKDIGCHFIHLGQNIPFEANIQIWVVLIDDGLKLIVRQLVARLELTVILSFFLDSIICQMDQSVAQIID